MGKYLGGLGVLLTVAAIVAWRPAGAQQEEAGKAAYDRRCATCHGAQGVGKIGPPLVPFRHDATALLGIVRQGGADMVPIPATEISDADVAAVAAYLKSLSPAAQAGRPAPRPSAAPTRATGSPAGAAGRGAADASDASQLSARHRRDARAARPERLDQLAANTERVGLQPA